MDLLIENGSLVFQNGQIKLTPDRNAAVAQRLKIRLGIHEGEWFLDRTAGLPWRDTIRTRPFDAQGTQALIINAILEDPEIESVASFDMALDRASRRLTFTFSFSLTPLNDGLESVATSPSPPLFAEGSLLDSGEIELTLLNNPIGVY